jgi:hypothetical protein
VNQAVCIPLHSLLEGQGATDVEEPRADVVSYDAVRNEQAFVPQSTLTRGFGYRSGEVACAQRSNLDTAQVRFRNWWYCRQGSSSSNSSGHRHYKEAGRIDAPCVNIGRQDHYCYADSSTRRWWACYSVARH